MDGDTSQADADAIDGGLTDLPFPTDFGTVYPLPQSVANVSPSSASGSAEGGSSWWIYLALAIGAILLLKR